MHKRSQLTYFRELCEGGPINQSLCKIIRLFLANMKMTILSQMTKTSAKFSIFFLYPIRWWWHWFPCFPENHFSFTHVNQSDVQKIMESLNTRKAHGVDGMPGKLLKLSAPLLAGELSRLMMTPLIRVRFHDIFKLAVVSSQFKKIENLNKSYYRPVSIRIVMSKVYERVMANHLLVYFENIFLPMLSAFRKIRLPVYAVEYGATF